MMRNLFGIACFLLGLPLVVAATPIPGAPEIDPATGVSAIVLLSGALVIMRSRRRS